MNSLPTGVALSNIPLASNPNGQPPNNVNSPSLAPTYLAAGIVLIIVSALCTITRVWTNWRALGKLGLDDCLCVAAEIFTIAYWALYYVFLKNFGKHIWDLSAAILSDKAFVREWATAAILSCPMYWASKAAILLFYVRIFSPARWIRISCYALLATTFCIYASNIVVICIYCLPTPGKGEPVAFAQCVKAAPYAVVTGVLSSVTALILFVIPFPIILNLQLERRKKTGLVIVFALGFLVVVASAVSLVYRVRVIHGQDPFWNFGKVALTSVAEVFGTIIVSCLPALSACWNNVVTKSKRYSTLRNKLSSRTLVSGSSKSRGVNSMGNKSEWWPRPPHVKHNLSYGHWDHALERSQMFRTHIYSSPAAKIPVRQGIKKSTLLEQTSDMSMA